MAAAYGEPDAEELAELRELLLTVAKLALNAAADGGLTVR